MTEPVTAAVAASAAIASVSPGFAAGTLGFIAGFLFTWPALIVLVVLGILFEHNGARGWAVFTALVVAAVSYFFFSVSLVTIGLGALAYIAIGIGWSIWRYKRHADKVVEANLTENQAVRDRAIARLHPKAMLGSLTAWIIIWPFSVIENFTGDIITGIQLLVQKVFRGIYHRIFDKAVAALSR